MSIVSTTSSRTSTQSRRVVGDSTSALSKVHFTVSPKTTTTTSPTTTVYPDGTMPSPSKDTAFSLLQTVSLPISTTTSSSSTARSTTWPPSQPSKALQDAHPAPICHNGFLTRGSGLCGALTTATTTNTTLHSLPASLLQQRLPQPKEHLPESQGKERSQFLHTQEHNSRNHEILPSPVHVC
ncbi:hypothetical protein EC968_009004 [Mortierella alpina]|nr:hypothetical protein EC968_009004 [Mortierella alpina]